MACLVQGARRPRRWRLVWVPLRGAWRRTPVGLNRSRCRTWRQVRGLGFRPHGLRGPSRYRGLKGVTRIRAAAHVGGQASAAGTIPGPIACHPGSRAWDHRSLAQVSRRPHGRRGGLWRRGAPGERPAGPCTCACPRAERVAPHPEVARRPRSRLRAGGNGLAGLDAQLVAIACVHARAEGSVQRASTFRVLTRQGAHPRGAMRQKRARALPAAGLGPEHGRESGSGFWPGGTTTRPHAHGQSGWQ